ncbi:biliverdin-producing heme oxygenase [Hymenobacter busanensis]|uniref:Biliverdin-producing heme oxygenase n=1 Tax=Hymenobacter busanensis TaxID=2607656 RepID=A0A7L5A2Q6_9BACT|nr:biliverdin-producing heme oxygenase [Hymenobacter busanensis]KAA9327022.1 biliverdin-producing heme oxygenase [Hymenobacter busanensis]QHJ09473.1 hypothetical protein GUY19_20210 [Hymenobacter busanensis]
MPIFAFMPVATTDILAQLRQQTRPYHEALEQNRFNQQLAAGTVSVDTTAWFLAKLYGFLALFEARLQQHAAGFGPAWEIDQRQRSHLILDDLRRYSPTTPLPLCPAMPALDTRAQLLGAFYVLEGSTLGGQVITRQLAQAGIPLRSYFSGYGTQTGPRWKRFVELLSAEAHAAPAAFQAAVVESASLTFQRLAAWINHA